MSDKICITLLCNRCFFNKMIDTLKGIIYTGYIGDICLVIGDDLKDSDLLKNEFLIQCGVTIKYFPDIKFSEKFDQKFYSLNRPPHWIQKKFQYHKFHLFDVYFKRWNYIFYVDCGMSVYSSIDPIINCREHNKLLAHSDAYPSYEWKLRDQFDQLDDRFSYVNDKYDLNIDYPQTTMMLYDTSIINENTYIDLIKLNEDVLISKTNDQGIIALYFTNIRNKWQQIKLGDNNMWYYDYLLRPEKISKPHIMLKFV